MSRTRVLAWIRLSFCAGIVLVAALSSFGQTAPSDRAVAWLAAQQHADGTWASVADLAPRDTARAILAETQHGQKTAQVDAGVAWLYSQRGLTANQFLSEQVLALTATGRDASERVAQLGGQHASTSLDFGGFAEYSRTAYDSALALQALASSPVYVTQVAGIVTKLVTTQNADGGWGLTEALSSDVVVTAEVLIALAQLQQQQPPQATIAAAQNYLKQRTAADGSVGSNILQTAVAFRALSISGAVPSTAMTQFLTTQQAANGSWSDDVYVTARALEAFAANKPNLTLAQNGFTFSPATVLEGNSAIAKITVTNSGPVSSTAATLTLYLSSLTGTVLGTASVPAIGAGASHETTLAFVAANLTSPSTIVAMIDSAAVVAEVREDDNTASATLQIAGKPDLQLFSTDISITPAHALANQPTTIAVSIRNEGEGDAQNVPWSVLVSRGGAETQVGSGVIATIAGHGGAVATAQITLDDGSYMVRVVVDPSNVVAETNESNNEAVKSLAVGAVSSVDLRFSAPLTATPSRPVAGESVSLTFTLENAGADPVTSTVALYDGAPGAGGALIQTFPVIIDAGGTTSRTTSYVMTPTTRVIYAVADPAGALAEIDETNNQSAAALTDALPDLVVRRDGFTIAGSYNFNAPTASGNVVVKNIGAVDATAVRVVVYDDLPASGGIVRSDTTVNVAAGGSVTVPVSWLTRHGQRLATVLVNPDRTIFEADFTNNRTTHFYTAVPHLVATSTINGSVADASAVVISPSNLTVNGLLKVNLFLSALTAPIQINVFEDVDGDGGYDPDFDNALGSTVVNAPALVNLPNTVAQVPLSGTVRFTPPRVFVHLDSTNASNEGNEFDNLFELYATNCQSTTVKTFAPGVKWTRPEGSFQFAAVARMDTNGDGSINSIDVPVIVNPTQGGVALHRGDTGEVLWSRNFTASHRQMNPAIGDLDGDGKPEILVNEERHKIVALRGDGTRKWTSSELEVDPRWLTIDYFDLYSYVGSPLIADLDADGKPEVVVGRTCLNGADGSIKWVGTGGAGRAWATGNDLFSGGFPDQEGPIAVDLDGDGFQEVVAGNTAYRANGSILWYRSDLPDGLTAPVWLTGSATPKICLVAEGRVWMLNSNGTDFWSSSRVVPADPRLAATRIGGAPTVFAMPTTNAPSVGVAGDGTYTVFDAASGNTLWSIATPIDPTFEAKSTNSAVVFNFGFGPYLAYTAFKQFMVIRASDGQLVYALDQESRPYYPNMPTVTDVTGDGRADIVVTNRFGIRVLTDSTWPLTRQIFNQASYHSANVTTDTGAIPPRETLDSYTKAHFRTNVTFSDTGLRFLPNLVASYTRVDTSSYPASTKLVVRVANNGWALAPEAAVSFFRIVNNASVLVGTATVRSLDPSQYADVSVTVPNLTGGVSVFYAIADKASASDTGRIAECNESDNRSPDYTAVLSSDIDIQAASLVTDDPLPRQGDPVHFSASATVTGSLQNAAVNAQFYLGDPAAGGTAISPLVPATITTSHGIGTATVGFTWTVTASPGARTIYVVFDPANALAEDSESNNRGAYAVEVATAEELRKVSADITLTPGAAEPGTPVTVNVLLKNIGNVPLTNVALNFGVNGPTSALTSASNLSLGKGSFAAVTLGSFTPIGTATYVVTLSSPDPQLQIVGATKSIKVSPFVSVAKLEMLPAHVPITNPIVQAHAHLSRSNMLPSAPLSDSFLSAIENAVQKGLAFQANVFRQNGRECYKCHVHVQTLASFEESRDVKNVTVDSSLADQILGGITSSQRTNGMFGDILPHTGTTAGVWGLSFWHDPEAVRGPITRALDLALTLQQSNGAFLSDKGEASFTGSETPTMMAVRGLARGYDLTRDERYRSAIVKAVGWALSYDYSTPVKVGTPELAARVAILIHTSLPYIDDPSLLRRANDRFVAIEQTLRSQQNPDGSFGFLRSTLSPVLRTAQCLYVLTLAVPEPDDPAVRAAALWLVSAQRSNGGWTDQSDETSIPKWMDETTWVMIAVPDAYKQMSKPFEFDLDVQLPSSTQYRTSNIAPTSSQANSAGTLLKWHFRDPADETDLYFDVGLGGLIADETRTPATSAALTYDDPSTAARVSRTVTTESVIGIAPLAASLTTDRSSYTANSNVTLTEQIENIGAAGTITNDVVIRDSAGTVVANVSAADAVDMPTRRFPGWRYALPVSFVVAGSEANRVVSIPLNLTPYLGGATFDANSLRLTAASADEPELYFSFFQSTDSASGTLLVSIPDNVAANSVLATRVYFDVRENGIKPMSMFNRSGIGVPAAGGVKANVHVLTRLNGTNLASVLYDPTPIYSTIETKAYLLSSPRPRFFVGLLTGAFIAPTTGNYEFLLGADDLGTLEIDGVQVLAKTTTTSGDGSDLGEVTTFVPLSAGPHQLRVMLVQISGNWSIYVQWAPPGRGFGLINSQWLMQSMPQRPAVNFGTVEVLTGVPTIKTYVWNTHSTAAGLYEALSTIRVTGTPVAMARASFTITAATEVAAALTTDKTTYVIGNAVHALGSVRNASNTVITGLTADVAIVSGAAVLTSQTTRLGSLTPGETSEIPLEWTAAGPAGPYTATIAVKNAAGVVLANGTAPFEIRAADATRITGTITAPAAIPRGQSLSVSVTLTNNAGALADAQFDVIIVDPTTDTAVTTQSLQLSIAAGGTLTKTLSFDTLSLAEQHYALFLVSRISGQAVSLANRTFHVTAALPTVVTASIASDRTAYDPRDTAHLTGSVVYASGGQLLTQLNATITIRDAALSAVASGTTAIATLAPGDSSPAALDWQVGVVAPGAYTAEIVVRDVASVVLAQKTITVEIRSTAVTAKGITATASVPAQVLHKDPLIVTTTVANEGNAAITDAPFSIEIIGGASQSRSVSIMPGAVFTWQQTFDTSTLMPGNYHLVVMSLLTGQRVELAGADFEVKARPTVVASSVVADKPAYDIDETAHVTATFTYTSGSFAISNAVLTTSILSPAGAEITIHTDNVTSLVPGQSFAGSLAWPVAKSVPGTYVAKSVLSDSAGIILTTGRTTFEVLSSSVSGKGVAGTIATGTRVTAGSPIPFTVTVTNSGNAPLTGAPFSVVITGTSTTAHGDFAADIAAGAASTRTVTIDSAALSEGTYEAKLVGAFSTPITLATTSFEVVPIPTVINAQVTADHAAYDVGDVAHLNGALLYASGPAAKPDVAITLTVVDVVQNVVASATTHVPTLAPGTTVAATLDWNVGLAAPGVYRGELTARDASGNVLAQAVSNFEVRSSAVTGKGITATATVPARITERDPLTVTVTIANNGNVPLSNASFAVQIVGGAEKSLNVTIASGAIATSNVTFDTTALAPGSYRVVVVSLFTGARVELASAAFEVAAFPTVVTATVATDRATYDVNETVHLSASAAHTSGGSPLTNASLVVSIKSPTGVEVSTRRIPVASLPPGQSVDASLDWPTATNTPGTYTAWVGVSDSAGIVVATKSAAFEIRSSATTGSGISAQVTVPATVIERDPLTITATITNAGNAPLSGASFALWITDANSQSVIDTIPMTVSVVQGASVTQQLPCDTTRLAVGSYRVVAVSLFTGQPIALATTPFEVKRVPIGLEVTGGGPPRVLIWAQTPISPPFITATLNAASIPWSLVSNESAFLSAMRSGAYSEAIVYQPAQAEWKIHREWLETIRGGFGVLYIKNSTDADPKLKPALGLTFRGKRNASSTLLDLLPTPFTTTGQLTLNGESVDIELSTAKAVANVAATAAPAIAWNTFGSGRVVTVAFDLEKTATPASAAFIVAAAQFVARTTPSQIVPITLSVTPPPGPTTLSASLSLPSSINVAYASPAFTSGTTWNLAANGAPVRLVAWVRLPDAIGSYAVTGSIGYAGQAPLVTKNVTLTVSATRASIEAALASDLAVLTSAASAADQKLLTDASSALAFLRAANASDPNVMLAAIDRCLELIDKLNAVSVDTTTARSNAVRLLAFWQSRTTL